MSRPLRDALAGYDLDAMRRDMLDETEGEVDDSIPQLAEADPELFAFALAFEDGRVASVGDARHEFTLQSAVKPFIFALALEDDHDDVIAAVGTEPTGEAFDAMHLEEDTGRPPNPMVNAGAILTASLVKGANPDERLDRILSGLAKFAGQELRVDEKIADTEVKLGDRNRALAYLMRSLGTLHVDVEDAIAVHAAACSVVVDTETLAVMAATLAFGGRNPLTGQLVVSRHTVTDVLSVMTTCGMYDGSGRWLRHVGLPAKSGISGGLFAASQGVAGIAGFSPRLDDVGNSVRAVHACERVAADVGLHVFARELGAP